MRPLSILLSLLVVSSCHGLAFKTLPEKVIVGYTSKCDDFSVRRAVENGVNVVVWSFIHVPQLTDTPSSSVRGLQQVQPAIETTLDMECIRREIQVVNSFDDQVVHLVAFGGWNGPHLDVIYQSEQIYETWRKLYGDVFDGIDWDLEGHDDLDSPTNHFTLNCLNKMGRISQLAKNDGYIVSIAPPQSYLDLSTTQFSRYVNLTHPGRKWHSEFSYAGANVYAYLLARYGDDIDMVSVQLYESYSRAAYDINELGVPASTYITSYVEDLALRHEKFYVDFSQDPDLNMEGQMVHLPLTKLVIGLANGWANGDKTLYVDPPDAGRAYEGLVQQGRAPRGFMFWTIDEEGTNGIYMADALNRAMHIR